MVLTIARYQSYYKLNGMWAMKVWFTNGDEGIFGNEDSAKAALDNLKWLSAELSWGLSMSATLDGGSSG